MQVRADAEGRPVLLCLDTSQHNWVAVAEVTDMWKINDEWWRGREQEIERVYYDVRLENGQQLTVFHDLIAGKWRRQAG